MEENVKYKKSRVAHLQKLTENDVERIIFLYETGVEEYDLAERFKVSLNTIENITKGDTWSQVPRPAGFKRRDCTTTQLKIIRAIREKDLPKVKGVVSICQSDLLKEVTVAATLFNLNRMKVLYGTDEDCIKARQVLLCNLIAEMRVSPKRVMAALGRFQDSEFFKLVETMAGTRGKLYPVTLLAEKKRIVSRLFEERKLKAIEKNRRLERFEEDKENLNEGKTYNQYLKDHHKQTSEIKKLAREASNLT